MKNSILCLAFAAACCLCSLAASGQTVTKTFRQSTLKNVLKEVERQTKMSIIYKVDEVDVSKRVTASFKDASVNEVLRTVLGADADFEVENNMITIHKRKTGGQGQRSSEGAPVPVKGKVVDSHGEPIIGASIIVRGEGKGTVTDVNGDFSLMAPVASTLEITYIGYSLQTVRVARDKTYAIRMVEDSKVLKEVVVTALGMKRERKALGYAVTEVGGDEVNAARPINPIDALSGKVPGVDISSTTAGPSGSTRVVIRGNGELSSNNQPLYVIDGVPMDNSQLGSASQWGGYDMGDGISGINPDDIETLSVLKGASAAALYGSRASHGVVLITTKSASKKGLGIEYSGSMDFVSQLSKFDDYQREYGSGRNGELPDTFEKGRGVTQTAWGAKLDAGLNTYIFNGEQKPYTNVKDNISSFFRTGTTVTNALSMTFGSDKASARFSVNNMQNRDIVPTSHMERTSVSMKASGNVTKQFKVEGRVNYIMEKVNNRPALSDSPNNVGLSLIGLAPNIDQHWLSDYKTAEGAYIDWNEGNIYRINPYWSINEMSNKSTKNRMIGYLQVNYDFLQDFGVQLRAGTDTYRFRMTDYQGVTTPIARQGAMSESTIDVTESNLEAIVRYNHTFWEKFNVNAFVGGNLMFYEQESFTNSATNQVIPDMKSITNYVDQSLVYVHPKKQIRSLYGAVNLAYNDFLYMDMTLRNDWSSTLAKGNNSYMYPSVSGSFIFSHFLEKNPVLSFGKIRASWAEVGGDTDPYMLSLNYGLLSYTFNGKPVGDITSTAIPNKGLKPTRTYSFELGTDLRFLDNRAGLQFTYYRQTTKDQIMNLPVSTTSGFEQAVVNSGEIRNQGVELSIDGTIVSTKDFSWEMTANYARNINKVVSLHPELKEYPLAEARWAGAMIEAIEGQAYGAIIGKKLKRTSDGQVIYGSNGLPLVGDKLEVLGNGVYDWTAGVGTTLTWRGLSLHALVDIKWGADVYSMSSMMAHSGGTSKETLEGRKEWYQSEELRKQANKAQNDWTPTGGLIGKGVVNVGTDENPVYEPNTTPVDPQDYWSYFLNANTPEPFIYDASFIKLRELTLSYSLKESWLKKTPLKGVSLSVYGRNLWTIHSSVKNIDPESSYNNGNGQGFEYGSLPSRRYFGFSVKVNL